MKKNKLEKNGFSLIELLVVMGVTAILLAIGGMSLSNIQSSDNLDLIATQVKDTIETARMRTLNGDQTSIYFDNNSWTSFKGVTYSSTDPSNQKNTLSSAFSFSNINFPLQTIVINKATGYPGNFAAPYNLILTESQTGKTRTFTINKIGVLEIQ